MERWGVFKTVFVQATEEHPNLFSVQHSWEGQGEKCVHR